MSLYLVGGCSSYQEINLEQLNSSGITDLYQFGIELTNASSCHCVTITSATGNFGSNLLDNTHTNSFWCNRNGDDFNQLCASNTSNLIFGSKIVHYDGNYYDSSCPILRVWVRILNKFVEIWNYIPEHLPTTDDDGNSVCPESINSSPPVSMNTFTTPPLLYYSESSSLATSASSIGSHTLDDQTSIMATPTTSYPFNYPSMTSLHSSFSITPTPDLSTVFSPNQNSTSYSSISSITPAPIMSQTSTRSLLTSPGASPSPTMLFCSEDNTWPITQACTNATCTSTECGNKSTLAKG